MTAKDLQTSGFRIVTKIDSRRGKDKIKLLLLKNERGEIFVSHGFGDEPKHFTEPIYKGIL